MFMDMLSMPILSILQIIFMYDILYIVYYAEERFMGVSNKIKALLKLKNKEHAELAKYFGMSAQSLSNKFYRDSFSGADLIKVADFLGCELAFIVDGSQRIVLDTQDIEK